jgi:alpha-1,2-glucosyltransferase
MVSYAIFKITGRCDIEALRLSNVATLSFIALECYYILQLFSRKFDVGSSSNWRLAHTAFNISLFPPLFFFSGLYYTDIQSLLTVLLAIHLSLLQLDNNDWKLVPLQGLLGLASLFFRQTNVFWVAVFPIGLIVLDSFHKANPRSEKGLQSVIEESWLESKCINALAACIPSLMCT